MPTSPPTITTAPPAPQRQVKATFSDRLDGFVTWLVAAVSQFGNVATNVHANAVEAFNNATAASTAATTATDAAAAATATANATLWVSGQSVAQYANKISPLDHQTYRRTTAAGSGATDPALDATNYALISVGQTAMALIGTATVGSAVANIDFLNVFSGLYAKYIIEVTGLTYSAVDTLVMRLAVGGSAVASDYATFPTSMGLSSFNGTAFLLAGSSSIATLTVEIGGGRDATSPKSISARGITSDATTAFIRSANGGWASTSVASGLRLFLSSGATFTAGTVRVYGVRA